MNFDAAIGFPIGLPNMGLNPHIPWLLAWVLRYGLG